ncbi:MAG: tetratricopeptide repeat protein [Desertifilum sp.]|nr:tetratricopeptide repeat protein [Desertifilum sp.]
MFRRILQAVSRFFQGLFGKVLGKPSADLEPNHPPLEESDYEFLYLQLLERVHQGWDAYRIKPYLESLLERSSEAQWVAWVRRFGDRLLASSSPNPELASRMFKLGTLDTGELGKVSQEYANQLLNQNPVVPQEFIPPSEEVQTLFDQGNQQYSQGLYQAAIASYDRAIALRPDLGEIWTNRGLALNQLQQYEEALANYDRALALKPDFYTALSNRGMTLKNLGRYQEALFSYDRAITAYPDFFDPWLNRGNILMALQEYQEAIASYDRAIALQIDRIEPWLAKANLLTYIRSYEAAIAMWDKVLSMQPDNAVAWTRRGGCLFYLERYPEAVESCDKALNIESSNEEAMSFRSKSLVKISARNAEETPE